MRVLGIDPGLTRCGLGVVDGLAGRRASLVDVGVVRTPADHELHRRLLVIADEIDAWLDRHRPDVLAVERVFSQNNLSTVMGTAQVSGIALLAAARRGLPVALHTPSEVKAAVTGNGRADKDQVTSMVTRILALRERPRPADAADALALALCHLWRGGAAAPARSPRGTARTSGSATGDGTVTPAQRAWARAEQDARRRSVRDLAPGGTGAPGALAASPARRVIVVPPPG